MRAPRFFNLFSLSIFSLCACSALAFTPLTAKAGEEDLRENIQNNLPEGEEIQSFLQLSPSQAWIYTTYSYGDSIQTTACTLSFIKMNEDTLSPKIQNSLTLLSGQRSNKVRAFDRSWSLPIESEGDMTLKNRAVNQRFGMIAETAASIESDIPAPSLEKLLNGLGQGQEIWMSFSLGEPQSLPTAHIIPLVNDFKHCTSENHFANLGGPLDPRANLSDNPF